MITSQTLTRLFGQKEIPEVRPGEMVKVFQKIQEAGKERLAVFEGTVIAKRGEKSLDATFTVRRMGADGIGIEKTFPLHSPTIVRIEKLGRLKVRRAKLYFLRELKGKKAKLKKYGEKSHRPARRAAGQKVSQGKRPQNP